jgi:hypothetical protein
LTKTATVFHLALFPSSYLFERISRADVILTLSDKIVDDKNHVNRCLIRTAMDRMWNLMIPIDQKGVPADECKVVDTIAWREKIRKDVQRAYTGLKFSDVALSVVREAFPEGQSEWLVDHLLHSFTTVLNRIDWKKEILRGDSLQRRRYSTEDEYLLNLCLEAEVGALIVGHRQKSNLNQRLFRKNDIELVVQDWYGSNFITARDSILDMIARHGTEDLAKKF